MSAAQNAPPLINERWRMLEHLFDAVAVVDNFRQIQYYNDCFRELAQIGPADNIGVDAVEILELPSSCWDSLKIPAVDDEPQIHSVPFAFTRGASGFAQVIIDRIPKESTGSKDLYLCIMRDITFEMKSKTQLHEYQKMITELRRSHAEAHFLWRLAMETPIYLEPAAVLVTIAKRLKDELVFADASFLSLPETDDGSPEPILSDLRIGSRIRQIAQSLVPTLRKKASRIEIFSMDFQPYGTFWIVNFRPKVERPFFLLVRSQESAKESNRKAFLEPLAQQVMSWLDNRAMYVSSVTDALTGLYNRRHFDSRFSVECLLARERKMILSLILIDIDHFKKVNDSYGHQTGDTVLKSVANTLKSVLRTSDIIARIGGEEFAVLVFDTSPKDAVIAAEKVRKAIESNPIPTADHGPISVTISAGIAGYLDARDTPASVFKAADEALYKAKDAGRNRTICTGIEST